MITQTENEEVLLGVRFLPQEEDLIEDGEKFHWHLVAESASQLMSHTLSPSWASHVNSPEYKDLWGGLLKDLNGRDYPVKIIIDAVYTFGEVNQEQVNQYLEDHKGKGPQFLVVFSVGGENLAMSCMWLRGWTIERLADE